VSSVFALSTSWCSHRHKDGYAMAREMADLGFDRIELSHGIRITLVPGILKALDEGIIRVDSTHNFCPLPAGVTQAAPNLFEPSSRNVQEREQWVRQTKRSIDFAAKVGARVLVCHLGSARFFWRNPGHAVYAHLERHPDAATSGDPAYRALLDKALGKLRIRMAEFWKNTRDSLASVLDHACANRVTLALENREKFEELPVDADFPSFLAGLPAGAPAGYWHDTGHAQIKASMGLLDHRRQLGDNASRLIGFHLHDVKDGADHQAIGAGTVDFRMVSEFWREDQVRVIELGPRVPPEEAKASRERLEALLTR
jgi:sugar phosphate isomerase/epimerase